MLPDFNISTFGAVCLDGSDAGFYFEASPTNLAQNKWQIFFEGGGWCYSEQDCLNRSKTDLGSSKNWPETTTNGGMMSSDCDINPDFCNFNRVYLKYCDGNSFSGNRDEPMMVNDTPVYFRGHKILQAVLKTLYSHYNLKEAEQVQLTGNSAGGVATFMQADYVYDYIKTNSPKLEKFGSVPVSGIFLDQNSVEGNPVYQHQMASIFTLSNANTATNTQCLKHNRMLFKNWRCNFAEYVYEFIRSPIFVVQSAFDSWVVNCIYTAVHSKNDVEGCNKAKGWEACSQNLENCDSKQMKVMNDYIENLAERMDRKTYHKDGNGSFIHSCHTHGEGYEDEYWVKFKVDGVSMREAVGKWWNSDMDKPAMNYKPCLFATEEKEKRQCNQTCEAAEYELKFDI